ncbi:MAG: ribonuclease R [Ruminococcus sp.]|uniref:ribonuclease R n=1 Tax=Ruminococcus sp. TaxID=41978 RepID=UPI001B167AAA|nr:ribonuclease R [Ruminococcus sp.]MBO7473941.1 ribonuclease R [Ruminococcus sp.]
MAEKPKKKQSEKKRSSAATVESYRNKIVTFLKAYGKKSMPLSELESKCRTKKAGRENFTAAFSELRTEGVVMMKKGMKAALCSRINVYPGMVTRLSRTFGFAVTDDGTEYFIPGKCMLGAMPNDRVLISPIASRSGEPEGEILDILEFGSSQLTGKIEYEDGRPYLVPDTASRNHIIIVREESIPFENGDKVLAEIVYRGRRHAEHKVKITLVFGSSEYAASSAASILVIHGAPTAFPEEVLKEARKISEGGVQEYSVNNREDLRDMTIFTIDSAESKDLDDAVSLQKTRKGYCLGVHIADVSHYVKGNSALDKEALLRGTSIYYADKVIPMLPQELSNGICSLNPNEDRLTLSAFMELDKEGAMLSYRFCKSVIRSRVKGVYSEINHILDGSENDDIAQKYKEVRSSIMLMNELADKLIARKKLRSAPEIETNESKLLIGEDGICYDVMPRERGKSERIIEEFMLTANEAAAKLAKEKKVPFVYRIHEAPPEAKTEALHEILPKYGFECPHFSEFKPIHAAKILESARGTDKFEAVNMLVLRSMAKAKYSPEPLGHFGLVLEDYAHFTSPIRRYPDLAIHRIITDILAGYNSDWLSKRYAGFAVNAADRSSAAEIRAVTIERECEDCYKAEYMKAHIGESFTAKISGVTEFGFYAELPNTVEGLVHIRSLPEGEYDYTEPVSLTERFTGISYTLGQTVQVVCAAVNVSDGTIDFVIDDDEQEDI